MNDLDDLRAALREPLEPGFKPADLGAVMAAGTRLRRRRRLLTGAGVTAVLAALTAGALLTTSLTGGPPANGPADLGPTTVTNGPSSDPTSASPQPTTVIVSGITDGLGEIVFFTVPIDEPSLPQVRFGLVIGHRRPNGRVSKDVETNEVNGSATTDGFHAVTAPSTVNGMPLPEFGYYCGAPAKITGLVNGVKVEARRKQVPGMPNVVVFWFNGQIQPTGLAAYDRNNHKLPSGDTSVSSG